MLTTGTVKYAMWRFPTATFATLTEHVDSVRQDLKCHMTGPLVSLPTQTVSMKSTKKHLSRESPILMNLHSGLNMKTGNALNALLASTGWTLKIQLEDVLESAQTLTRNASTATLRVNAQNADVNGWPGMENVLTRFRTATYLLRTNLKT